MARARNIKPSFFTNELLGTEDPVISLTFAGLWCLADKEGILEDRPLRIKAELFPYRENLDVNGYLTVLQRLGFIHRYVVNGVGYLQVINFEKHQCPHDTEKSKKYPKYHDVKDLTVKPPLSDGEKQVPTRSDSLIHDSLIEDSLIPDSPIQGSLPAEEVDTEKIPRPSQTAIVCLTLKGEGIGAVSPSNPKLRPCLRPVQTSTCSSMRQGLQKHGGRRALPMSLQLLTDKCKRRRPWLRERGQARQQSQKQITNALPG